MILFDVITDIVDLNFVTLLLLVFYLLAFRNVIRVMRQEMSAAATLSWIIINVTVPFLGVPLFYFLGQNTITGYTKRFWKSQVKHTKPQGLTDRQAKEALENDRLQLLQRVMIKLDPGYAVAPYELELLINGAQTFPEIFRCIENAKHCILVQYYIIRQDRLGLELKNLLCKKAAQNVRIFLLIDDWGSFGLGREYVKDLIRAGVKVARFLPFRIRFNFQVNFRNHRKLVLIDGEIAFTGGLNIGVEYQGRKRNAFWRDTHLKIVGPSLRVLMETFSEDWYFATRQDIRDQFHYPPPSPGKPGEVPIQIVSFGPGGGRWAGLTLYFQAICSAKRSLVIATPYFIPDVILENALHMAALRGVEITLLIPKSGDNFFVHVVSIVHASRFAKTARVAQYQNGFMHQKVMLIDSETAILGTMNVDNRSIYLNFETAVVVHDAKFCQGIEQMLAQDLAESRPLDPEKAIKPSIRPFAGLIRLMGPLF